MQEYFNTKFSTFIRHIAYVFSAQTSIKVNVRFSLFRSLRYNLTFSSVRTSCCFRLIKPGFRSVADPRSSDCFHWAKLPTLFQKYWNSCSVSNKKFPQCLDPSLIFVRYFTHNQSCRPNCDYDLKYWRFNYNAMLHVNIKIMTSQQRWYLLLSYFHNKINFLFNCEIRS